MIAPKPIDALSPPHPDCPACQRGRHHEGDELKVWHPYAGHGYTKEQGWTHPDLGTKEKA